MNGEMLMTEQKMTEQERKERIAELLKELKELQATPRSDWHAGFEALLRIETHKYEDKVHIITEEEIGVIPPRTDFVIMVEDEEVVFDKAIFKMFRKINILEYKNPYDSLNERVIRKVCGYANLYIGVAEHEGDRPSDQVTITIFRAVKNPELFAKMEQEGKLVRDDVPGIYHVNGIVDLPFQIIITGELEGDEYAAYRALTDRAAEVDVERIIQEIGKEKDDSLKEYYGVLIKLIIEKNPQFIEVVRRDSAMEDVLMEIVKDRVDEKVNEKVNEKERETKSLDISSLMTNLKLTLEQAMDALNIPQSQREIYAGLVNKKM